MNRLLKVLGVAMVAALAMSVVASGASAAEFTAEEYTAEFHGENTSGSEVFSTEAGNVECDSTFSGSAGEASSTVTAVPVYTNCEAFGFLSATVNTEGCHYLFHLGDQIDPEETDTYTATATVECPKDKSIKITAATCAAEVGSQGPLNHVLFEDTTNGFVDVWAAVEGIDYTVTKDGFLCPFSGTGAKEGGEYNTEGEPTEIGSEQGIHIG